MVAAALTIKLGMQQSPNMAMQPCSQQQRQQQDSSQQQTLAESPIADQAVFHIWAAVPAAASTC
jgi:hypothetical protein